MKLLIATDAWRPQVNGVVRTLETTISHLQKMDYEVRVISPQDFYNFRWPFYKDISVALPFNGLFDSINCNWKPEYVHIATEGSVGLAARRMCVKNGIPFTTSYHTRFPEYLKTMYRIPLWISYSYLKWFHSKSSKVLVPTHSMKSILDKQGFKNVAVWSRGVDLDLFKPYPHSNTYRRPLLVYVGRVSSEKNIEDFLNIKIDGSKLVIGDGPQRSFLEKKYPEVSFLGMKTGEELARLYSEGDVFVFPSKSDTFGLVLLESLACGVPFASYLEPGPLDIIENAPDFAQTACFVGDNLEESVKLALEKGNKVSAVNIAKVLSWENCTKKFSDYLKSVKRNEI